MSDDKSIMHVVVNGPPSGGPFEWDEETWNSRFDLYGALYVLCSLYHSGQSSRGYRILSRLSRAGYQPSPMLSEDNFESEEQERIYRDLLRYTDKL